MSGIQFQMTRYARKQGNTTHNEEQNHSIETDPDMTQLTESVDEDTETSTEPQNSCTPYVQEGRARHGQDGERHRRHVLKDSNCNSREKSKAWDRGVLGRINSMLGHI